MRILWIGEWLPYPPESGALLRSYELLRRVAARHDVWLVAFTPGPPSAFTGQIARMRDLCRGVQVARMEAFGPLSRPLGVMDCLRRGLPFEYRFARSRTLEAAARRLAAQVDPQIAQIEFSFMTPYLDVLPPDLQRRSVLALHDVDYVRYGRNARLEERWLRRLRLQVYARQLRRSEPRAVARFARAFAVSETDRQALLQRDPTLRLGVLPNGVDTEDNQPLPAQAGPPSLLYVGNMEAPPNADAAVFFCREVLPQVRRQVPGVELWIVGRKPLPQVQALAGDGVHVTGRVDDLHPYYARSQVVVVPLRSGGGTRLKILEAMALGRPVVSTVLGAEGLEVRDGEHLLLADEAGAFAGRAARLLQRPEERLGLALRARVLVEELYGWDAIADHLLRCYDELAGEGPGSSAGLEALAAAAASSSGRSAL